MIKHKNFDSGSEGSLEDMELDSYIDVDVCKNTRVYYKKGEHSAHFIVVRFVSCDGNEDSNWNKTTEVEVVFEGDIRSDGLRHLYMGLSQVRHGYTYYLRADEMVKIFTFIADLEKEIEIALDIPPSLSQVRADQLRFSQIIGNLLGNALKYSPLGSIVTISAREDPDIKMIQIDVADVGEGIPAKSQAQLFTKFFRTDHSTTRKVYGAGLGLFIAKHLVEAHGGRIWVQSEEGRGSTFSFALMMSTESVESVETPSLAGAQSGSD